MAKHSTNINEDFLLSSVQKTGGAVHAYLIMGTKDLRKSVMMHWEGLN